MTGNFEIETRRNEWAARQLGVEGVYRDDNCFIEESDPDGVAAAFVLRDENEREVLIRNTAPHDTMAVLPHDFWLGLA